MILVSDQLMRRAAEYLGRALTAAESDEFRRMAELINREEDDVAWTVVLATWAARVETTAALTGAKDGVQAGLDAWMDRVEADMKVFDGTRRSVAKEIATEAERTAASVSDAATRGVAALSDRMTGLDGRVAAMAATVEKAMKDSFVVLAAAKKRDVESREQIKALIAEHAQDLSNRVYLRTDEALQSAERRLDRAATQAQIAARPLILLGIVALASLAVGSISTVFFIEYIINPH